MTDAQFNQQARELYEGGKVEKPYLLIYQFRMPGEPERTSFAACINERHLREWLEKRDITVNSELGPTGIRRIVENIRTGEFLSSQGWSKWRWNTYTDRRKALLAAVKSVPDKQVSTCGDVEKCRRIDSQGRDVTDLPGLWDESDSTERP